MNCQNSRLVKTERSLVWKFVARARDRPCFMKKDFLINKCTRAMEQREEATGLSEAREAADR